MESALLYLHIGSAKAGSTSIQAFLKHNRRELPYGQVAAWESGGNAWKIAASSGTKVAYEFWVKRRQNLTDDQFYSIPRKLWPAVQREVEESSHSTFVASSEYCLVQVGSEPAALKDLRRKLLSIFSEVKIILYLRSQTSYLPSLYSQRVKGPFSDTQTFEQFAEHHLHRPHALLYRQKLESWVSVFGRDNVDAVVFSRKNFANGNLIADFLNRIDIESHGGFEESDDARANVSPSYSELKIIRRLNHLAFIKRSQRREIASFLQRFRPEESFPQTFNDRVIGIVSEENQYLNKEYFQDLPVKLPVMKSNVTVSESE